MESELAVDEIDRKIRRLRKKLRQIENLENSQRSLNDEETAKVRSKIEVRNEISELCLNMKRKSSEVPITSADDKEDNDMPDSSVVAKRRRSSEISSVHAEEVGGSLNQEEQLEISVSSNSKTEATREPSEQPSSSSTTTNIVISDLSDKKHHVAVKKSKWRQRNILVHEIEGHEDLVVSSDLNSKLDIAITSSRDTNVLVWKISTRKEIFSLRGHSDTVTSVKIIDSNGRIIGLTGSLDCALKVWDLENGKLLKSVYTYDGIKCLSYHKGLDCAVTGTDGGKLEFFQNIANNHDQAAKTLHSIKAHDDVITTLDIVGDILASGSRDGIIKVWKVSGANLECIFDLCNIGTATGSMALHLRCILSLKIVPNDSDLVVYGDGGCNIKILDWKKRILLQKLPNHTSEMGFTDSICIKDNHLLASSYDLDTGLGHINMFQLRNKDEVPSYICSWSDEETSRIFHLSFDVSNNHSQDLTLMTVGREMKLWQTVQRSLPKEDALLIKPSVLALYVNSVVDSGSSDDDSELSEQETNRTRRNRNVDISEKEKSSWGCIIL